MVSRGPARAGDLVEDTTALLRGRLSDAPDELPLGVGPLWVGGMAFDADGGGSGTWSSFPPALLCLPEVIVSRLGGRGHLTVCAIADTTRSPDSIREAVTARLASLRVDAMPQLDPHPTGTTEVVSVRPPAHYEDAVAKARELIRAGRVEKLVLAREVRVDGSAAHSPAPLFAALRESFPSCFCFCAGTPEAAFVGASPELLVRRAGAVAATVALAGSTRRSADPSVDDHLGEALLRSSKDRTEHEIVANRIARRLDSSSVWVERADEPVVIKVANIQHLATPIHAQLTESRSVLQLAAMLHPTPAVGSEPSGAEGERLIAELEGLDRGWYAGPVGWMDAAEDGEFCVALRATLLRDRTAHLFAGAGIVADSDPAAELAETEVKLAALLPLLMG